jgi:hypothetical protein
MTKNNIILIILAGLLFVAGYVTKTTMQKSELDSVQLAKIERKAKREKRKELTPTNNNSRTEKKQRKKANQIEDKSSKIKELKKSNQTDEEKQQQKKERRAKKIDQNLSDKTWWNKKGGSKVEDMDLSDEVKALMDEQVASLLKTRKELGAQLSMLNAIAQQSLEAGDIIGIEQNLESIQEIKNSWDDERQAAILTIIRNLSNEQLINLSQSKEDISTLNWFDFDLTKGIEKNSKKRKSNSNKANSDT